MGYFWLKMTNKVCIVIQVTHTFSSFAMAFHLYFPNKNYFRAINIADYAGYQSNSCFVRTSDHLLSVKS